MEQREIQGDHLGSFCINLEKDCGLDQSRSSDDSKKWMESIPMKKMGQQDFMMGWVSNGLFEICALINWKMKFPLTDKEKTVDKHVWVEGI